MHIRIRKRMHGSAECYKEDLGFLSIIMCFHDGWEGLLRRNALHLTKKEGKALA